MSDMLDFHGDFWEDLLDCQPPVVDNKSRNGGLTYAATDYLGVYPASQWVPELGQAKRELFAMSQNRKARRDPAAGRKSHNKGVLTS